MDEWGIIVKVDQQAQRIAKCVKVVVSENVIIKICMIPHQNFYYSPWILLKQNTPLLYTTALKGYKYQQASWFPFTSLFQPQLISQSDCSLLRSTLHSSLCSYLISWHIKGQSSFPVETKIIMAALKHFRFYAYATTFKVLNVPHTWCSAISGKSVSNTI